MSALFNFHSFLTVVLLVICTCTFVKLQFPAVLQQKTGFRGFFWKAARIGERLSPWVAAFCFGMGLSDDKSMSTVKFGQIRGGHEQAGLEGVEEGHEKDETL